MKTEVTLPWVAREAALGFIEAWGRRRKPTLAPAVETGAYGLAVDVAPTSHIDEMLRRARRAGRILADEAMRKRLRVFASDLAMPEGGATAVRVVHSEFGMALRLTNALIGGAVPVYRLDMRGAR